MRVRNASKKEYERVIDDYITQGYSIISRGETATHLKKDNGLGGFGAHLGVFLLTVWWTFGLGNLAYAVYSKLSGERVLVKLE